MKTIINEDRVRGFIWSLKEQFGVPLVKLGEVLGSRSGTVAGRTMFANRHLRTGEQSLSIEQINRLATFFEISPQDILFPR